MNPCILCLCLQYVFLFFFFSFRVQLNIATEHVFFFAASSIVKKKSLLPHVLKEKKLGVQSFNIAIQQGFLVAQKLFRIEAFVTKRL